MSKPICPFCENEMDYLLPDQVAQLLRVPSQTVRRWLREGRFNGAELKDVRGRKVWRIPATVIVPLLEANR